VRTTQLFMLIALFAGLFGVSALAADEDSDAVLGVWLTAGDDKAEVTLFLEGDELRGRITTLRAPLFPDDDETHPGQPKVDRENPDPDLRSQPVEGMEIVWGFNWDAGDQRWESGRIYDPENGKTYKCWIQLRDDGTLKVRGYIGFSLLGRTEIWTRVGSEPAD
jgi:uncharacterized protein (DUF2147 family)